MSGRFCSRLVLPFKRLEGRRGMSSVKNKDEGLKTFIWVTKAGSSSILKRAANSSKRFNKCKTLHLEVETSGNIAKTLQDGS